MSKDIFSAALVFQKRMAHICTKTIEVINSLIKQQIEEICLRGKGTVSAETPQ